MRRLVLSALSFAALCAVADVQIIDGKKYECKDGICRLVGDEVPGVGCLVSGAESDSPSTGHPAARLAQGYMPAGDFIAFLEGREAAGGGLSADRGIFVLLLLVLLGGLAMNLTPCVLPMMPINLMIIGRSARRGLAYGLGIALAYGLLGVGAAVGGLAFGDIQGNPWFNAVVAVVFVGLALALFDVWFIDFSRFRKTAPASSAARGEGLAGMVTAFFLGALSAVLAGACVAPILISVLLLTADLFAKGNRLAILLPFVMGAGMALPWPFAGAGLKVLPRPGAWMKWVNRAFGVVVLGFAAWYGRLAWQGWSGEADSRPSAQGGQETASPFLRATPSTFNAQLSALGSKSARPILVDCWATWCKNCAAMDAVLKEDRVQAALRPFTVIRMQAEDISELRQLEGFESIRGLPAFVIFE